MVRRKNNNKTNKSKGYSKDSSSNKEKGECPYKGHNSPEWYMREQIPHIGLNWAYLGRVSSDPNVLPNGLEITPAVQFETLLTPPVDPSGSFYRKIAELYAELRETNSGAANYTKNILGGYIWNVITLRALAWHVLRALAAVRMQSPIQKESPSIYVNLCGFSKYFDEVAEYADNFNEFAILVKDIESLPVPPVAFLDRAELFYSSVFLDNHGTRPTMEALIPTRAYMFTGNDSGTSYTATSVIDPSGSSAKISAWITLLRSLYVSLLGDDKFTIVRGDMLKAFGNGAVRTTLMANLMQPLRFSDDEDVLSQIENATILGDPDSVSLSMVNTSSEGDHIVLNITAKNGHMAEELAGGKLPIDWHKPEAPSTGELLSITRLKTIATKTLGAAAYTNVYTSGITILEVKFINGSTPGALPSVWYLTSKMNDMFSSVQSTAVAAIKRVAALVSRVSNFPILVLDPANATSTMIDLDNYSVADKATLVEYMEIANRSLMDVHLPRKSDGRIDKGGSSKN